MIEEGEEDGVKFCCRGGIFCEFWEAGWLELVGLSSLSRAKGVREGFRFLLVVRVEEGCVDIDWVVSISERFWSFVGGFSVSIVFGRSCSWTCFVSFAVDETALEGCSSENGATIGSCSSWTWRLPFLFDGPTLFIGSTFCNSGRGSSIGLSNGSTISAVGFEDDSFLIKSRTWAIASSSSESSGGRSKAVVFLRFFLRFGFANDSGLLEKSSGSKRLASP